MGDSYAGESSAKKMARYLYWEYVRSVSGSTFFTRRHVFLASRFGGDIAVLTALGVSPQNMVPVELDPIAAAECQGRWPSVKVICADVAKVAEEWVGFHPASVYLDYCAQISPLTVTTTRRVLSALGGTPWVGFSVLRGREQESQTIDIFRPTRHGFNTNGAHTPCHKTSAKALIRDAWALLRGIQGQASPLAVGEDTSLVINGDYRSQLVDVRRTLRLPKGISPDSALVRLLAMTIAVRSAPGVGDIWPERSWLYQGNKSPMAIGLFRSAMPTGVVHWMTEIVRTTPARIKELAVDSALGPQTSDLLNIPKGTVAAWRAHVSRNARTQ